MTIGTNVSDLVIVHDNKEFGKVIDPNQWNANFKEIEDKVNMNNIILNELINRLIAVTDNASGGDIVGITPIKEGGASNLQAVLEEMKVDFGALSSTHATRVDNPHTVTKAQIGLGNVDNTADANKNVLSATKLTTPRLIGSATFDGTSNITLSQIDVYSKTELQTGGQSVVDWNNITNKPNLADGNWQGSVQNVSSLPTVGNNIGHQRVVLNDGDGKQAIYSCVATSGTIAEQWDKVADVDWMTEEQTRVTQENARVSAETQRGVNETSRLNAEATRVSQETQRMNNEVARQEHYSNYNNPHQVDKTDVGLSNVDNTSDADKPVSTAQQNALNGKLNTTPVLQGNMDTNSHTIYGAEFDNGNSGANATINWNNGNHQKILMTDNCTFVFTAPTYPTMFSLRIVQDGTGNKTITLPTHFTGGGGALSFTLTANAIDILTGYYDGLNYHLQVLNDSKVVGV